MTLEELLELVTDSKYYFVREGPDSPITDWFGPCDFRAARAAARYVSTDEDRSGRAEIVVYIGTRPGDPTTEPVREAIEAIYSEGIMILRGRAAAFNSPLI